MQGWRSKPAKDRAGTLKFVKISIWMLNLANVRMEGASLQRMRVVTLGFAKLSTCMLDLANARVEWACEDGSNT